MSDVQIELAAGAVAERLALGVNDAVVVTVPVHTTREQIAEVRRQIERALPGRRSIIVSEGTTLRGVGPAELPPVE